MRIPMPLVAVATVLSLATAACIEEPATGGPGVTSVDEPDIQQPDATAAPLPAPPPPAAADESTALLVTGVFDPEGQELLQLNSATVIPGEARLPAEGTEGIFILEVTYVDGTTTRVPFDALIADDSDPGTVEHGFFEVAVQLNGEIASIRILGAGDTTFAEISADDVTR